jgi:hypothetical protein
LTSKYGDFPGFFFVLSWLNVIQSTVKVEKKGIKGYQSDAM